MLCSITITAWHYVPMALKVELKIERLYIFGHTLKYSRQKQCDFMSLQLNSAYQ